MNYTLLVINNKALTKEQATYVLQKTLPETPISQTRFIDKQTGFLASTAGNSSYATIIVFHERTEFLLASTKKTDQNNTITLVSEITRTPINNILILPVGSQEAIECQEPRCTRPAKKDHNGLKLCQDHYEQWQEKNSDSEWERRQYR